MSAAIRRRHALLALGSVALPSLAALTRPLPPELQAALPGAQLLGEARLRWLGLHVYDIRLWGDSGFAPRAHEAAPLALELEYARDLEGKAIAERSLQEMKNVGPVSAPQAERWLERMRRIFPDVKKGDRLTGVQRPGEAAVFFVNGQPRGEVRDAEFTRLFFGIWLSPRTSQPKLRDSLVGARAATS